MFLFSRPLSHIRMFVIYKLYGVGNEFDKTECTLLCKTSFKMKNLQLFRTNNSLSNRNTLLEDYCHLCIFIPRELMNWHDLFPVKEMKLEKRRAFAIFLLKDINLLNIFSCI